MGKIISYIIYFLIAIAIYVFIRATFTGEINVNTTIGQAANEVKNGSIQTLKDMRNDASTAINDMRKVDSSKASKDQFPKNQGYPQQIEETE